MNRVKGRSSVSVRDSFVNGRAKRLSHLGLEPDDAALAAGDGVGDVPAEFVALDLVGAGGEDGAAVGLGAVGHVVEPRGEAVDDREDVGRQAGNALRGTLGANPVEYITHFTGLTALTFLLITLSVTPARRLSGVSGLIQLRRMLGLYAFFYALLHFAMYSLDQTYLSGTGLSLAAIGEDIAKRPYITVGFTAFLMLIALASTSTNGMVRRLGGKRWRRLHQLVYVAAALGVLHFLWLVKADVRQPATYGLVLVGLLSFRLVRQRVRRARQAPAMSPVPPTVVSSSDLSAA